MAAEPLTDDVARALRSAWFRYLDEIEPLRPGLHRYCLHLTGDVWDAEDLVQDALLRGFGAIGRGDLHGDASRVAHPRAYLLRTASNLWIDGVRRRERDPLARAEPRDEASAAPAGAAREAGEVLFDLAHVAADLGLAARVTRYHQPPEILKRMIATTGLPWASSDCPG